MKIPKIVQDWIREVYHSMTMSIDDVFYIIVGEDEEILDIIFKNKTTAEKMLKYFRETSFDYDKHRVAAVKFVCVDEEVL